MSKDIITNLIHKALIESKLDKEEIKPTKAKGKKLLKELKYHLYQKN